MAEWWNARPFHVIPFAFATGANRVQMARDSPIMILTDVDAVSRLGLVGFADVLGAVVLQWWSIPCAHALGLESFVRNRPL